MNKIKMLVATIIIAAFTTASFSEATPNYHKALTNHHENAKMHADAIATGTSKTKAEHLKHANEASKSLVKAKYSHVALKSSMPVEQTELTKQHHVAIEKYHAEAAKHSDLLNAELKKKTLDETKFREHARLLSESIDNAEKEHQALNTKTK
jgi:hypothetical protein